MAEQEACTELVEKASQDQVSTTFEGESQLLPLLQGLLEAPDNEQTADSGTESGEDQRNGLIAEVQNALAKLSASLRDDATDIATERRTSLLQLVTKLQAGLSASVPTSERRSSVQSRFRRRQRPNRHTVGVSSEELADARRLIEEISLHELTPTSSKVSLLKKQNSEGSVGQSSGSSFKNYSPQKTLVKNAVAKPFSSSNSTVSGNSSSVQTPTEPSESLDFLFNEESIEKKPDFSYRSISLDDQNLRRSSSGDVSIKSVQQAVQQAAAIKVLTKSNENLLESEETTDEDTTVKAKIEIQPPIQELPKPDLVMQNNPIYQQQQPINDDKINKFHSRKLKMKRANTIDIPKPLNFYEDPDDSDCSLPEEDYNQRRRSNYLALRGPIRIGNSNGKNAVPVFEPKTDNDKKFLAFINKHNENNSAKNSLWSKQSDDDNSSNNKKGNVWSNKFGHIKTAFEKASAPPTQSQNSARLFWKTADDAVTSPKFDGPKISKQSARNLRQMFEEKQKDAQKLPWSVQNDKNVVTGSLKVKAFEPNEKPHKFVPQPLPVNKFSHAPQSAFKPLPKKAPSPIPVSKTVIKSEIKEKDLDSPLFLYSPKTTNESSSKPWLSNSGESRVLSLAASKFENAQQQENIPIKPRKLSKEKILAPFQQQSSEKLTAPYLVKSVEQKNNSTVRQLSGQYNNLGGRNDGYSTPNTVKYSSQPKTPSYEHSRPPSVSKYYSQQGQNYPPQEQQYQYQTPQTQQFIYQSQYYPQSQYQNQNYHQNYSNVNRHDNYVQSSQPSSAQAYYQSHLEPQEPQYTSTYQYQPRIQTPSLNYTASIEITGPPPDDLLESSPPKLESQVSVESLKEYNAVNSRVMTGPVCQQATTVRQKSPMNRDGHDMAAALNLKNSLQKATTRTEKLSSKNKEESQKESSPTEYGYRRAQEEPRSTGREELKQMVSPPKNFNYRNQEEPQFVSKYQNREEPQKVISPTTDYAYRRSQEDARRSSRDQEAPPKNFGYKEEPQKAISPTEYRYRRSQDESRARRDLEAKHQMVSPPKNFGYEPPRSNYQMREEPRRIISPNSFSYKPREEYPKPISPHSFSYKSHEEANRYNKYRNENRAVESLEINDNGESIVTSKFQIPVINVPQPESPRPPNPSQLMNNKADSWNQICKKTQQPFHKPSPRGSPNARTVTKSKSSHTLALPKQFEAGMTKDEMAQKRKTMEAFMSGGNKSPQSLSRTSSNENLSKSDKVVKRSINRLKTCEKLSTYRQSSGLSRSRTLPDIVCPDLLDESNVDKAFEDLFRSSS